MRGVEPPRFARQVLRLLVSGPEREYILGDLAEGFRNRVRSSDLATATRWYRSQAFRAVPTFVRRAVWGVVRRRPGGPLRGGGQDLRWAVRALRRRPTYALASAGTIGLGLGAAAAVLSVANSVWFRPLPFEDPEQVVRVFEVDRNQGPASGSSSASEISGERTSAVSPPLLNDLQQHAWRTFAGFSAIASGTFDWSNGTETRRLSAVTASPNLTDMLGVRPIVGRSLSGTAGAREVLLTEPFWRSVFGADERVAGRVITLNDEFYEIVGVLPQSLTYPRPADIWTPLEFSEDDLGEGMRGARYLGVIARIRPSATHAAAAREVDAFVAALGDTYPINRGWGATVIDLRSHLVSPYKPVLTVLLAGAGLFLLLATVNVGGLVAARRAADAHDFALRRALGASRWRLLRHGFVEAALIAGAGLALAYVLAIWVLAPIKRIAPPDVPRLDEAGVGGYALLLLACAAGAVAVVVAVIGHLMARPGSIASIGRGRASVGATSRVRYALTVIQVSLTTMLLLGGAVLARHAQELASIDPGFVPDGVLAAPLAVPERRYPDAARQLAFYQAVVDGLGRRGMTAGVGTNPPISGSTMRFGYRPGGGDDEQYWAQYHTTSPDYFRVLSIPLVAGRTFVPSDDAGAPPVVIVSEAIARRHFAGDAVGRPITVVGTRRTIVGVVGSTRHFGPDEDPPGELYVPFAQDPWSFTHVLLRSDDGVSAGALREVVHAIDPRIPVTAPTPFGDFVAAWFAPLRFQLVIIGLFGLLGTVLAAVGVYALVSYVVASRTREIGIQVALGAAQGSVVAKVLRSGLALVGAGLAIGIVVALAAQRVVQNLVGGIDATDPVAYLSVTLALALVASLACAVPARRAAAVDPVVALRSE